MANLSLNLSKPLTRIPAVSVTESDNLGIDFESAEYSYPITPADEADTPEQAEAMEVSHG